jgi:GNAT superfamily N-acetyltransferase
MTITLMWCKEAELAGDFGHFFASNISEEYISHSELQGPRAADIGSWVPDLEGVLTKEIELRIKRVHDPKLDAKGDENLVMAAWDGDVLVGLSLVSFFLRVPVAYGVIEDLVVSKDRRGEGIGTKMLDWITREAKNHNCHRLFLESGITNTHAHRFFEDQGFIPCSIVMFKRLCLA